MQYNEIKCVLIFLKLLIFWDFHLKQSQEFMQHYVKNTFSEGWKCLGEVKENGQITAQWAQNWAAEDLKNIAWTFQIYAFVCIMFIYLNVLFI